MAASSTGLKPEKDCAGKGQQHIQKTDPSSRQREVPTSTNPQLSDSNKNWVVSPRWKLYSKTDWPADRQSLHKTQTKLTVQLEVRIIQWSVQSEDDDSVSVICGLL
jgi:hypothetical protein